MKIFLFLLVFTASIVLAYQDKYECLAWGKNPENSYYEQVIAQGYTQLQTRKLVMQKCRAAYEECKFIGCWKIINNPPDEPDDLPPYDN